MLLNIFLLIVGLAAIVFSADILIKASSNIAKKLGVSSFVIGITVVAFGTSAPELVIGIMSGVSKTNSLTYGNIMGSGLSNIALILGICAIIMPLKTKRSIVLREIPMLIGVELILFGLSYFDKVLSLTDGLILIAAFVLFMVYIVVGAKKSSKQNNANSSMNSGISIDSEALEANGSDEKNQSWIKLILLLLISLAGLFIGGKLTVDKSSAIAASLGLSDVFIGVTVVAIATTLPELVASLMAVKNKEEDIVLGNCIGSNIFNVLLVLGLSATLNPIAINTTMIINLAIMLGLTLIVFLIVLFRNKVSRLTGILLFITYILFLSYQVLSVTVL